MGKRKQKKKPLIQVELGLGGLCAVTVVCLLLFLWMYMFGVWTGQSALKGSEGEGAEPELAAVAARIWQGDALTAPATPAAGEKTAKPAAVREREADAAPSFFAIQVAAFKDRKRAEKSVLEWRGKEYFSFYLLPEKPHGTFHKVFIGRFAEMAEAKTLAAKLENSGQGKVFITLVPANQSRYP